MTVFYASLWRYIGALENQILQRAHYGIAAEGCNKALVLSRIMFRFTLLTLEISLFLKQSLCTAVSCELRSSCSCINQVFTQFTCFVFTINFLSPTFKMICFLLWIIKALFWINNAPLQKRSGYYQGIAGTGYHRAGSQEPSTGLSMLKYHRQEL